MRVGGEGLSTTTLGGVGTIDMLLNTVSVLVVLRDGSVDRDRALAFRCFLASDLAVDM